MILAINANAAVDQVLFIDRFAGGTTMRTGRWVLSVGGKALDSAVVLKTLGAPVRVVSLVAGRNGETLASEPASQGASFWEQVIRFFAWLFSPAEVVQASGLTQVLHE